MAVSLDCERVRTEFGMETAWISIIDQNCRVIFKQFIKPEGRVTDYLTFVTGLRPSNLRDAPSLQELRPSIRKLLKGRLIVGHSVQYDLDYLGINDPTRKVCDIADFPSFRNESGLRRKLKDLAWEYLGMRIQQGPHDPEEDARAAMELYRKFVKEGSSAELRNCAGCGCPKDGQSFSNNQWRKGPGASRCTTCVTNKTFAGDGAGQRQQEEHMRAAAQQEAQRRRQQQQQQEAQARAAAQQEAQRRQQQKQQQKLEEARRVCSTKRENLANSATLDGYELDHPFAQGAHRYCARGRYTSGARRGQLCVGKWFKTGGVFGEHFFEHDIKATQKAVDLVSEWNNRKFTKKTIQVNVPGVWTFQAGPRMGQKALIEPFIQNFKKFNSNSGWASDIDVFAQALSHFTYHVSGGQFVLCDLQGGVYNDTVVLTDPVILSRSRCFGITDLGPEGISNFFYHHKCTKGCRSEWTRPKNTREYFQPRQSTSMILRSQQHVSQRYSQPVATLQTFAECDSDDDY